MAGITVLPEVKVEDEEGKDEYKEDGFILDDVDEDEQDADHDERQQKNKRKKREYERKFFLDEDDFVYEILTGFRRPNVEVKKFKGLKKERADAGFSDEEEYNGIGNSRKNVEEKLECSLFGEDEGPSIERFEEDDQRQEEGDEMPDIYFYEDKLMDN